MGAEIRHSARSVYRMGQDGQITAMNEAATPRRPGPGEPPQWARAIVRFGGAIIGVPAFMMASWWPIKMVALVLVGHLVAIMSHEAGHFIVGNLVGLECRWTWWQARVTIRSVNPRRLQLFPYLLAGPIAGAICPIVMQMVIGRIGWWSLAAAWVGLSQLLNLAPFFSGSDGEKLVKVVS